MSRYCLAASWAFVVAGIIAALVGWWAGVLVCAGLGLDLAFASLFMALYPGGDLF